MKLTTKELENIEMTEQGAEILPYNKPITLQFAKKVLLYLRDTVKLPSDKYIILPNDIVLDGLRETNSGLVYDGGILTDIYTGESIKI